MKALNLYPGSPQEGDSDMPLGYKALSKRKDTRFNYSKSKQMTLSVLMHST